MALEDFRARKSSSMTLQVLEIWILRTDVEALQRVRIHFCICFQDHLAVAILAYQGLCFQASLNQVVQPCCRTGSSCTCGILRSSQRNVPSVHLFGTGFAALRRNRSESSVYAFRTSHLPQACPHIGQGLSKGHVVLRHQHDAPRNLHLVLCSGTVRLLGLCLQLAVLAHAPQSTLLACSGSTLSKLSLQISDDLPSYTRTRLLTVPRLTAKPARMFRFKHVFHSSQKTSVSGRSVRNTA